MAITPHASAPIGVFDSGVGGLTVVSALRAQLPNESILYLGDMARLPYGSKSKKTVIRYSLQVAQFLLGRGIKLLVVACNTASSYAIETLAEALPIPVVGVVYPGADAAVACTQSGRIGVIGTLATVGSGAYPAAILQRLPSAKVVSCACPLLVPLAEEGWVDHPVAAQVVRHYLHALRRQGDLDTLVLGCTHYPLLHTVIVAQARGVFSHMIRVVDSARCTADAVAQALDTAGLSSSGPAQPPHFMVTDDSRFVELAKRFLGHPIAAVEHVDL